MQPSLWLRNPHRYLIQAQQSGITRWVFSEADLEIDGNFDPKVFMDLNTGVGGYTAMIEGESEAVIFDDKTTPAKPLRVIPVKSPGRHDQSATMQVIRFDSDESLRHLGRDRFGLHIADVQSFSVAFGREFTSVDIDFSRYPEAYFCHPGGGLIHWSTAKGYKYWIALLGYHWEEMEYPAVRVAFSISSAIWSSKYWDDREAVANLTGRSIKTSASMFGQRKRHTDPLPGDKYYCGSCSFSQTCAQYREGSVCTVSGEAKKLAEQVGSRDAHTIIDFMTELTKDGLKRYEMGREAEKEKGRLDPALTSLGANMFRQGKTILQLHHPEYRNPLLQIQFNGGSPGVGTGQQKSAQQLASQAKEALLTAGCQEDEIEFEHIEELVNLGITDHAIQQVAKLVMNPVIEAGEVHPSDDG